MNHLVTATTKGQITLPVKWRKNFATNRYLLKENGKSLTISPVDLDDLEDEGNWETIFNADRDNDGQGVPIEEFIKALENIQ